MTVPRFAPLLLATLLVGVGTGVHAQQGFLFRQPRVALSVEVTHTSPRARGELFDVLTGELTLGRGDFSALGIGGRAAFAAGSRAEVVLGASWLQSVRASEFRAFVGEDDEPIAQTTRLLRVPVTAGVRYALLPRGRRLAEHVWIPARLVPYLQAGGGWLWYRLEQEGEFVDAETLVIFEDELRSAGNGVMAEAGAGAELRITSRLGLHAGAAWQWASPPLRGSFGRFDAIDLSGTRIDAGITYRF